MPESLTEPAKFEVRQLTSDDMAALRDLRHRILRPGRPLSTAMFEGDDYDTTIHLGAFMPDGELVGGATLIEVDGIQLRGMATDPVVRGKGAGAAILAVAHSIALERRLPLWCNARLTAVGFYEKFGWRTVGDAFEVPKIGLHYLMRSTRSEVASCSDV